MFDTFYGGCRPGKVCLQAHFAVAIRCDSADDQINPPELKIIDVDIQQVKQGKYVLLPITNATRGHGTHSLPQFGESI